MPTLLAIAILFFIIALIYSSVGFGGGSSYIAILVLFNFAFPDLRVIALACNIIVVLGGVYKYHRAGLLNIKKSLPIILLSVPFAFIGAIVRIEHATFLLILSILLLVAAFLMVLQVLGKLKKNQNSKVLSPLQNNSLGIGLGFLSGVTGIGGGIYLSPILNLINWDDAKKIAATCSLFILLNSMGGLIGHYEYFNSFDFKRLVVPAGAVLFGGQIGNRIGIKIFSQNTVRLLTAALITFVAIRIIINYLQ